MQARIYDKILGADILKRRPENLRHVSLLIMKALILLIFLLISLWREKEKHRDQYQYQERERENETRKE